MAVNKYFFNAASEFSNGNITERFPTFQIEDINIGFWSGIHNEINQHWNLYWVIENYWGASTPEGGGGEEHI